MNKIRLGIWGLGRAGNNMQTSELEKFSDLYDIVAGCDIDPERRERYQKRVGCKLYDNQEEFLLDPDVELISIATRSPDHTKHAIQALETGKYVFLEKPIALSYAEALTLKETADKYPGKLFLRHNRRFEAPFNHIQEIIQSGVIGDVYEVKLRRNGYMRRADWQTIIECGGGQLNNWGPHIIEHGLRFLNSPVKEIWSDLKLIAAAGDAEDHLKVILKGENGCLVDLEISGGAAIYEPEYIVLGTKGGLSCSGNTITLKHIDPEQVLPEIKADPGNPPLDSGIANNYANVTKVNWVEDTFPVDPKAKCDIPDIWKALYQAIRENITFPITIDQGIEVVHVTEQVKKGTEFEMK